MNELRKNKKYLTIVLFVGNLFFFLLICITNLFHFCYKINSDIASEAILGKVIWDSKELIPGSWYISSETRIISTPDLAALFYGLTKNMTLAMGLSCCTMTVLIILGAYYFGRTLDFQINENLLFVFLCLMLPMDFMIIELFYLFSGYYAIHVVIMFFTLGVYINAIKKTRLIWPAMAVSVIFAFVLGVQGARGILVIYGPLFGTEVIRNLHRIYCGKEWKKTDLFISIWVMILLVAGFLGMLAPVSVGQNFSRNIRKGLPKFLTVVLPDMCKALGISSTNTTEKICAIVLFLIIVYLLADILFKIIKKREIETIEWGFLAVASSPLVSAFVVSFTTFESTERYYFQFVYVTAYAVVLFFRKWKQGIKLKAGIHLCVGLVIVMLTTVHFYSVYLPIMRAEEPRQNDYYKVVKYLEENDYEIAYSNFDNSNLMTALSNSRVIVAAVDSFGKMNVCKWLTSSDWYVPNRPFEERTAYIIPEMDMKEFDKFLDIHKEDMSFETKIGIFSIYSSDYNFSQLED